MLVYSCHTFSCIKVSKSKAFVSNSLSKINGECVTATNKLHLFDFRMSGSSFLCHSKERDNSGSSKRRIKLLDKSRYILEKIDIICFSPEDKFLREFF